MIDSVSLKKFGSYVLLLPFLTAMDSFPSRRPVTKLEFTPPSANIVLLSDRRTVRWNSGK